MGMFDYVQCDARLPVKRETRVRHRENPFQSKSVRLWEDPKFTERAYNDGCVTLTIRPDRTLADPDGNLLNWSGELVFYGDRSEFIASCKGGVVESMTEVTD